MNSYILRMEGSIATIAWEFRFHQTSNNLAAAYARRLIANCPAARQSMSIALYNITADTRVSTFTFGEPQVREAAHT